MDPLLLLGALLLAPVAIFLVLAFWRRARFRALAGELGGRHSGWNPLVPGAIDGDRFRVEAVRVQKSYRTQIRVRAPAAAGEFLLEPGFFRATPDWQHARVPGSRTERVFLWEVELAAYARASAEQREELLAWLPPPAEFEELRALLERAEVRSIQVSDGSLSTSFRGIVSDRERIRGTLEAFRRCTP